MPEIDRLSGSNDWIETLISLSRTVYEDTTSAGGTCTSSQILTISERFHGYSIGLHDQAGYIFCQVLQSHMSRQQTGEKWTVELDDNVLIWEFLSGMELSSFRKEAFPVYQQFLSEHDIEAMVTDVRIDDPFNSEVFEVWEESARVADREGVSQWAIVAEGIKAISLGGKIDTGDLETLTTEERSEAIEWAKN